MNAINELVLKGLTDRRETILSARQQPVAFRPATWRRHLLSADAALLDEIEERGARIERENIRRTARDLKTDLDHRRLFLAVMIWGSGTRNGRGPYYTGIALRDGVNLAATLARTAEMVRSGEHAEAYRTFRVPKIGPAFFTKWFWAASSNTARPALIFDSRVRATLGALNWNSREAAGTRNRALRYQAYVAAMHEWAGHLGTTAEQLELYLFLAAGHP